VFCGPYRISVYITEDMDKGEIIHEKGERITRKVKECIQHNRSLANLIYGIHMTASNARCRQLKYSCNKLAAVGTVCQVVSTLAQYSKELGFTPNCLPIYCVNF
jgi:hypothetical protein